jgi:uncharacterized protein
MQFDFEWDPAKARSNLIKNKISFERAAEIFLDPLAVSIYDNKRSLQEDRWITMGKDRADKVLLVIHTFLEQQKTSVLFASFQRARQQRMKRRNMKVNHYEERI